MGIAGAQEGPDEMTKKRALMLGYTLNGNSMIRWGSVDVMELLEITKPKQVTTKGIGRK
jgi:hypothetical protein